ncbi:MAG: hypothetical protein D6717_13095 [Gammaproteobacteria bacterium]|nr:MAG: hypothetical protein D6717_13095 [Gammaproteobacteria bacterium]
MTGCTELHISPLGDQALLLEPGEGFSPDQADDCLVVVQEAMQRTSARWLIFDLTRVVLIDRAYHEWLLRLHRLARLQHAGMLVAGMRPAVAWTLVQMLDEEPPYRSLRDIDEALQFIRGG